MNAGSITVIGCRIDEVNKGQSGTNITLIDTLTIVKTDSGIFQKNITFDNFIVTNGSGTELNAAQDTVL